MTGFGKPTTSGRAIQCCVPKEFFSLRDGAFAGACLPPLLLEPPSRTPIRVQPTPPLGSALLVPLAFSSHKTNGQGNQSGANRKHKGRAPTVFQKTLPKFLVALDWPCVLASCRCAVFSMAESNPSSSTCAPLRDYYTPTPSTGYHVSASQGPLPSLALPAIVTYVVTLLNL